MQSGPRFTSVWDRPPFELGATLDLPDTHTPGGSPTGSCQVKAAVGLWMLHACGRTFLTGSCRVQPDAEEGHAGGRTPTRRRGSATQVALTEEDGTASMMSDR